MSSCLPAFFHPPAFSSFTFQPPFPLLSLLSSFIWSVHFFLLFVFSPPSFRVAVILFCIFLWSFSFFFCIFLLSCLLPSLVCLAVSSCIFEDIQDRCCFLRRIASSSPRKALGDVPFDPTARRGGDQCLQHGPSLNILLRNSGSGHIFCPSLPSSPDLRGEAEAVRYFFFLLLYLLCRNVSSLMCVFYF